MINEKKIILATFSLAIIAEIFLFYIIYFNPHKILPIMDSEVQTTLSGIFNLLSAMSLLRAFLYIKNKNVNRHKLFIYIALLFSTLFLINYILYHLSVGHVVFNNQDYRSLYLSVLLTHLIASVLALPMVFITFALGIFDFRKSHKKMARPTFFIWSYVSLTGVLLVLFIKFLHIK